LFFIICSAKGTANYELKFCMRSITEWRIACMFA